MMPWAHVTVLGMMRVTTEAGPIRPWALALCGSATIAVAFGFARYGFGLFVPVFRAEFGLSAAAVGAVGSAGYAAYLVGLLGSGWANDRFGPRLPILFGTTAALAGLLLVAVASGPAVLGAGVLIAASSAGWVWAPFSDAVSMLIVPAQRARVLAVISTGTTFGLVLA